MSVENCCTIRGRERAGEVVGVEWLTNEENEQDKHEEEPALDHRGVHLLGGAPPRSIGVFQASCAGIDARCAENAGEAD